MEDLEAVQAAAERLFGATDLTPETELLSFAPDSLAVIELAMDVEDSLGVEIPDEPLQTVQDLLDRVEQSRSRPL